MFTGVDPSILIHPFYIIPTSPTLISYLHFAPQPFSCTAISTLAPQPYFCTTTLSTLSNQIIPFVFHPIIITLFLPTICPSLAPNFSYYTALLCSPPSSQHLANKIFKIVSNITLNKFYRLTLIYIHPWFGGIHFYVHPIELSIGICHGSIRLLTA